MNDSDVEYGGIGWKSTLWAPLKLTIALYLLRFLALLVSAGFASIFYTWKKEFAYFLMIYLFMLFTFLIATKLDNLLRKEKA